MGRMNHNHVAVRAARSNDVKRSSNGAVYDLTARAKARKQVKSLPVAVNSKELLQLIKEEMHVRESCRTLPLTLMIWFTFILVSLAHRQVPLVHSMHSTIDNLMKSAPPVMASNNSNASLGCSYGASERRLKSSGGGSGGARKPDEQVSTVTGKSFETINSLDAAFLWIQTVGVPILWKDFGRVSTFYKVVGGLRLNLVRAGEVPCETKFQSLYGHSCGSDVQDKQEHAQAWLDLRRSQQDAIEEVSYLCQNGWNSRLTRTLKLRSILYNGELAQFVVITVGFKHTSSGGLLPKMNICTLGKVYGSSAAYLGDMLWGFLACLLAWRAVKKVYRAAQKGTSKVVKHFQTSWTIVDWVCIMCSIGIGGFWSYFSKQLPNLGESLHKAQGDVDDLAVVYDEASKLCRQQHWNETCMFWYTLLLMVKFFQVFKANPRLDVLVITLQRAAFELGHFLIVFLIIFFNYALGGFLLFGGSLEQWSRLGKATGSTFRALVGDFAFEEMQYVAPVSSLVWFWTFMLLMGLIMLNMLLAIVLDVYNTVKEESKRSETLYEDAVALVEDINERLPNTLKRWEQRLPETLKKWGFRLPKLHTGTPPSPSKPNSPNPVHRASVAVDELEKWMDALTEDGAAEQQQFSVISLGQMIRIGIRVDRATKLVRKAIKEKNPLPAKTEQTVVEELILDQEVPDPFKLEADMASLEQEFQSMRSERKKAYENFTKCFSQLMT